MKFAEILRWYKHGQITAGHCVLLVCSATVDLQPSEMAPELPAEVLAKLRELANGKGQCKIISNNAVDEEYEQRVNIGLGKWQSFSGTCPNLRHQEFSNGITTGAGGRLTRLREVRANP